MMDFKSEETLEAAVELVQSSLYYGHEMWAGAVKVYEELKWEHKQELISAMERYDNLEYLFQIHTHTNYNPFQWVEDVEAVHGDLFDAVYAGHVGDYAVPVLDDIIFHLGEALTTQKRAMDVGSVIKSHQAFYYLDEEKFEERVNNYIMGNY